MPAEEAPALSKVFSQQLKGARERRGWSQQTLADNVAEVGGTLDRVAIAKIERGIRGISLDEAYLLAAALGVNPTDLIVPRSDEAEVAIAPKLVVDARQARRWVLRQGALPGQNEAIYAIETSDDKVYWLTIGGPWFDRKIHEVVDGLMQGRLSPDDAARAQAEIFSEFQYGSPTRRIGELVLMEMGEETPLPLPDRDNEPGFFEPEDPVPSEPPATKGPRSRKTTEGK